MEINIPINTNPEIIEGPETETTESPETETTTSEITEIIPEEHDTYLRNYLLPTSRSGDVWMSILFTCSILLLVGIFNQTKDAACAPIMTWAHTQLYVNLIIYICKRLFVYFPFDVYGWYWEMSMVVINWLINLAYVTFNMWGIFIVFLSPTCIVNRHFSFFAEL